MSKAGWFGLVIFLVGATGAYFGFLRSPGPPVVEVGVVQRGDIDLVATAEAFVRGKTFEIGPELAGRVVELPVREGERVLAGAILFRLDPEDLQAQVAEARAAYATAASAVGEAVRAREAAESALRTRLAQARAQVREAEARLRDAERGTRPEAIEVARHEVERLTAIEREMKRRLDRAEMLFGQGATSKAALDAARTDHEIAVAQREAAEDALAEARRGPLPESADAARAQLEAARAGLDVAQSGREEVELRAAQVRTAQARADEATTMLQRAQTAARKADVRSPISGIVVRVQGEVGMVATPGRPVVVLSTRADLHIEAEVRSEDLDLFQPGTPAEIALPSTEGRTYPGRVESLGAVAEPKQDAALRTRVVRTRIRILGAEPVFVPGMEVDVTVRVVRRGVLVVPNDALTFEGESPSVWRVAEGLVRRQNVRIGVSDAERTEIVEGLAPGDQVVVDPPESLRDRAKVKARGTP